MWPHPTADCDYILTSSWVHVIVTAPHDPVTPPHSWLWLLQRTLTSCMGACDPHPICTDHSFMSWPWTQCMGPSPHPTAPWTRVHVTPPCTWLPQLTLGWGSGNMKIQLATPSLWSFDNGRSCSICVNHFPFLQCAMGVVRHVKIDSWPVEKP